MPTSEIEDLKNHRKMSRKRQVDAEGRLFEERWEGEYLFVLQGERPVCLLRYDAVSVFKEYTKQGKQHCSRIERQTVATAECVHGIHGQK